MLPAHLAKAVAAASESAAMPFTNVQPVEGRVCHIDGDYAAYYCSGKDGTPIGMARRNVLDRIERVKRACGATAVTVHLTHGDSHKGHRFLIAESRPYQGQRNASRKPDNWYALRDYMENYEGDLFEVVVWPDREADDGMAYLSHVQLMAGKSPAIHSRDKDMRMYAALHVEWQNMYLVDVPLGAFELYDREGLLYGHKWFWMQMLTGDNADHIPGLPRLGKETAPKILHGVKNNEQAFDVVSSLYRGKMGSERWADYFVEQAGLLWMRTDALARWDDFQQVLPFNAEIDDACLRLAVRVQAQLDTLASYK